MSNLARLILALIIVTGAVVVSYEVLAGNVPKDPTLAALVGAVVGYVFAETKAVTSFYFGSSSGSQAKDETIQIQAKTAGE